MYIQFYAKNFGAFSQGDMVNFPFVFLFACIKNLAVEILCPTILWKCAQVDNQANPPIFLHDLFM
jgi:hypothetical protein